MIGVTPFPGKLTLIAAACKTYCYSIYLNSHPELWRR